MHSKHYVVARKRGSTPVTVNIHHDGDYGGDVIIMVQRGEAMAEITIPSAVLFNFVADAVRDERIGALEQAAPSDVLGLPAKSYLAKVLARETRAEED